MHSFKKSILSILLIGASSAQAQVIAHEQKLMYENKNGVPDTNNNVGGNSVAIDGEWAFVGNVNQCQVYVYKFDHVTNLWGDGDVDGDGTISPGIPYAELRSQGSCKTAEYGGFGASVSTSNGLVIVGAPGAKSPGLGVHGRIFIYSYDPAQATIDNGNDVRFGWVRNVAVGIPQDRDATGTIIDDVQADSGFGTSVSVKHNESKGKAIIVAGSPLYDGAAGPDTGKVYVYEWDTPTNTPLLINAEEGENAGDQVGTTVTSNGVELLASAPYFDGSLSGTPVVDSGAVYLFDYNVSDFTFTLEHRFESGFDIGGSEIIPILPQDYHLGMTLSYEGDIIALGGTDTLVIEHSHAGNIVALRSTIADTNEGDASQSGDIINIAVRGDIANGIDGSFNVYFNKYTLDPLPTPDFTFTKSENDYGRDISLSMPRLLVNGNGNTVDGTGDGIAYAYYPTCGLSGTLTANEWQVIGLQCIPYISDGITRANIGDLFSDDLGTYGVDWGMYSREAPNYDGRSSSYTWMQETDTMKVGVGYWILSLTDASFEIDAPLIGENIPKRSDPLNRPHVGAVTKLDLKGLMTANGNPTGRDGTTGNDMRVLLANPLVVPTKWGDASWKLINAGSGEADLTLSQVDIWFENNNTTAYTYDPGTNWWKPVAATETPGVATHIAPGQGFNVKFSNSLHSTITNPANSVVDFQLAEER